MKSKTLLFVLFTSFILISTAQTTIHVPGDQPTIQAGITAAISGDTVLVDQGIYEENISLQGKTIFVTSNYIHTLDSADIYNTIIDGSKPADTNQASVVTFPWGSDTTSVICGFTIRKGKGTLYTNRVGGGILCFDGGKIIHNNIINNSVYADEHAVGSGIYAQGSDSLSYFVVKNNIIEFNQLENTNSNYMCWGSIGLHTGYIIVKNNIVRSNTAKGRPYGVGIYLNNVEGLFSHNLISYDTGYHTLAGKSRGGGMYVVNIQPGLEISNNKITHNHLIWLNGGGNFRYGGGIAVLNTGGFEYNAMLIDKNIIEDNTALLGAGISITGLYNITISNNVIRDNEAGMDGGGLFLQNIAKGDVDPGSNINSYNVDPITEKKSLEQPLLVNNTIINNHADFGGGIYSMMYEKDFIAFNNIIYENTATSMGPEAMIEGNCIGHFYNNNIDTNDIEGAGTWTGDDNIFCNPDFEDDSCHLSASSYCINMGTDTVKMGGITYVPPDHDIYGEERPQNDLFDIGADERRINNPGIKESAGNRIRWKLYPNPANNTISIVLQPGTKVTSFDILDNQGKIVLHQEVTDKYFLVNVSMLPNGLYFVRIHASEGIEAKKLIIQ